MFGFTLLMISREGMETALLMGTLLAQVQTFSILAGAIAGTLSAAGVAWLWSRYGHRVNLGLFFQVTAIFLGVFVVQLVIYGFHELTEANLFPNSEALHWATEPYGPDGVYGQFLTYLAPRGAAQLAADLDAQGHSQSPAAAQRPSPIGPETHVVNGLPSVLGVVCRRCRSRRQPPRWCGRVTCDSLRAAARREIVLDSDGVAGPTPPQALAMALAGCMAIDVVDIVRKGRHPVNALTRIARSVSVSTIRQGVSPPSTCTLR